MNAFLVDLENKPGALATVAEALGTKGVNITNVAGATCGDSGRAAFSTSDPVATREALQKINATFKELEVTEITLADQPGSLGKVARRLASAGVNIEAIFPMGMTGRDVSVGFATNNPTKAREALSTVASTR
jgi:hypothetical protein